MRAGGGVLSGVVQGALACVVARNVHVGYCGRCCVEGSAIECSPCGMPGSRSKRRRHAACRGRQWCSWRFCSQRHVRARCVRRFWKLQSYQGFLSKNVESRHPRFRLRQGRIHGGGGQLASKRAVRWPRRGGDLRDARRRACGGRGRDQCGVHIRGRPRFARAVRPGRAGRHPYEFPHAVSQKEKGTLALDLSRPFDGLS